MDQQKYEQTINFLETLINIPSLNFFSKAKKSKRTFFIKRTKFLLDILGNPEKDFKYIHITGTSGKSSLTCFLQSILSSAGIKTGAYFSPHATEIRERIKVNDKLISPEDLCRLTEKIKPALAECARSSLFGVPSYLEILLVLGLLYFREQKCEYVVLEAGCGGLFDATNLIDQSKIAIITNVGIDHTEILGKTKREIAIDKAGIIKKNSIFFTGEQNKNILKIFKTKCKEKNAAFNQVEFKYKILKCDISGTRFKYKDNEYELILLGEDQVKNAILALEAVSFLINDKNKIASGLKKAYLPCRLQVVQNYPIIILDGAHNPNKLKSTSEFVKKLKYKKLHLIIGLAENKDLYNTLKYILPLASNIYLTRFLAAGRKSKRLGPMWRAAKKLNDKNIEIFIDPWQALESAEKRAKKNDLILVTGSFFLAGELRKKWLKKNN